MPGSENRNIHAVFRGHASSGLISRPLEVAGLFHIRSSPLTLLEFALPDGWHMMGSKKGWGVGHSPPGTGDRPFTCLRNGRGGRGYLERRSGETAGAAMVVELGIGPQDRSPSLVGRCWRGWMQGWRGLLSLAAALAGPLFGRVERRYHGP